MSFQNSHIKFTLGALLISAIASGRNARTFAKVLIPTGTAGALADTYTQQQECEPLRRLIELRLEKENKSKDTHAAQ